MDILFIIQQTLSATLGVNAIIFALAAIGLNMHLSHPAKETGNARLYELAYRGVAQVVDSSNVSAVNKIFNPNSEILLYESTEECISQLNKLINDKYLRISIATAAYNKAIKEYSYESVINKTCIWFRELKKDIIE